jgi:hypothetical protein
MRELHSYSSGKGPVVGSCEHGNEPSGSIKGGTFLYQLSDYQLYIKKSVSYVKVK